MTRPSSARAPRGAAGACRDPRRASRGGRAAWVRPYARAKHALDASVRLIDSTLRAVRVSERCAIRRPVHATRNLREAGGRLIVASKRLTRAAERLAQANHYLALQPELPAEAPELLLREAERWASMAHILGGTASYVFDLHKEVLHGLEIGELVPERPAERRPRIVLIPRPAPVRAFLRARLPRVTDRISPMLLRRRRTRRPAAVSVPRRTSQGRAPPLFPVCLL
ncbi:MAG TPA: hypothetical protein VEO54_30710 [Thermoanaerobaculia bacterium]|nr:hypothetical protein [Thermoanaerobaculia bacterium]